MAVQRKKRTPCSLFVRQRLLGFSLRMCRRKKLYQLDFDSFHFCWQITLPFFHQKVPLHAFLHHLALFLFYSVPATLSHNLFRPCQKNYSQNTCLNRGGLWCYTSFLPIGVGPLPDDISESTVKSSVVLIFNLFMLLSVVKVERKQRLLLYFQPGLQVNGVFNEKTPKQTHC